MNAKDFFQRAKEKGITKIQITEKQSIHSSAKIIDGKLESFDDDNNVSFDIKAEYQGKTVKTTSNYLEEDILDVIILKATTTDTKYEDDYLETKNPIEKKEMLDFDISNEIKILKKMDKLKEKYQEVQKLTSFFSESYTNTRIINSNGVDISTDSHLCKLAVEAIIEKDGKFTSFDRQLLATCKTTIDFEKFTQDVIEKAIIQSNQEKITTQKYDILLDSSAAGQIISHLVNMLSATNIRNKVSCLEKKLNQEIFSKKLTIIEDPTNSNYPGYRLFDDEGTSTYKKTIIEKGVLKSFLYDVKEAKIENIPSTGNGYQNINTRNMYVKPGRKSLENLMKEMQDGIYIVDYMGASNTAINTATGDISIQIFGFIIKNGKIITGIEPAIMTTTIFELLSNIEAIGNDLNFMNIVSASPSLFIKNISLTR